MARGAQSPAPAPLPKVHFWKAEDVDSQLAGVHDLQARSFGYNDGSEFERPVRYIKYIEPLDTDLDKQVEYDMDEQDQDWVDAVNAERQKEQMGKVSYETFEVIMDRLEKEWFGLTKNISQPDMALPSEDSTCAICDDSEGENMNAIVFCDGCNLAVHQDCYGVPYIPEGQWLCRKCTVSPESAVSCVLCPNEGGAFKQTVTGEWVHLLCAIWVPETRVANDVFMEPVNGVDRIPKQRWKLRCGVCGIREGACIQCAKASCYEAFHATCARREKFLMPMKSADGVEPTLSCFCEKHLPQEQQEVRAAALADREDDGLDGLDGGRSTKTARAYAKTYKTGPPLVPAIIVERIVQYIGKVNVRKKVELVILVCKYWSLKREARRGAPLLKRLHLEPWTATSGSKQQSDEEKAMKLDQLKRLRADLEQVRTLNDLSRQREALKLQQAELTNEILSSTLYPHEHAMRAAFDRICAYDRKDFFKNPISRAEVPDYFEVIKRPMCWSTIQDKLDRHEYWNVQTLRDDVRLVLDNATKYNKSDTPFYKTAYRLKAQLHTYFAELNQRYPVHSHKSHHDNDVNGSVDGEDALPGLEPPIAMLNLLTEERTIAEDTDLILGAEPIVSLFNFEYAVLKPPPPPPPAPTPPPPKRKKEAKAKAKRDDLPRKRLPRDTILALDAAPGFRATRGAAARAAAFEAEANEPTADADVAAETPEPPSVSVSAAGKRRRLHVRPPGKVDVPPLVDDVDAHASFQHFERGWVLPEGSKRRGRAEREVTAPPPKKAVQPKKPARTHNNRQKSLLSESTPASENLTLPSAPSTRAADEDTDAGSSGVQSRLSSLTPSTESDDGMGMDDHVTPKEEEQDVAVDGEAERTQPSPDEETEGLTTPSEVEEHESPPATSPQQAPLSDAGEANEQPDAEMQVDDAEVASGGPKATSENLIAAPKEPATVPEEPSSAPKEPAAMFEEPVAVSEDAEAAPEKTAEAEQEVPRRRIVVDVIETPATRREARKRRVAAELAAKMQEESASASAAGPSSPQTTKTRANKGASVATPRRQGKQAQAQAQELGQENGAKAGFESGTFVWAKAMGFPFWPAVVFDADHPIVPPNVVAQKPSAGGPTYLVRFFDKHSSWQWVRESHIDLLGEGEDRLYLDRKGFKDKKIRNECDRWYQKAKSAMEAASKGEHAAQQAEGADGKAPTENEGDVDSRSASGEDGAKETLDVHMDDSASAGGGEKGDVDMSVEAP